MGIGPTRTGDLIYPTKSGNMINIHRLDFRDAIQPNHHSKWGYTMKYPLVFSQITMENPPIFHGKNHGKSTKGKYMFRKGEKMETWGPYSNP
jgi:hypothetical protein